MAGGRGSRGRKMGAVLRLCRSIPIGKSARGRDQGFPIRAQMETSPREISGTIEGPQDYVQGQINFSAATHNFARLDSPLPVKVKISNGSGVDQVVPSALMLSPYAKMTLPQGIGLALSYSEKIPPKVVSFFGTTFQLWLVARHSFSERSANRREQHSRPHFGFH